MVVRRSFLSAVVGLAALALAACGSDADTGAANSGGSAPISGSAQSSESAPASSGPAPASAGSAPASSESAPDSGSPGSAAASGVTAASGGSSAAPGGTVGGACTPDKLTTTTPGTLTIATSEPVFEPWMVDNDPSSGKGFESAVAYGVATQLGYSHDQVTWKRVGFDEAIAKQAGWDFAISQYSISDQRKKMVDFSSGYYDVTQAVITIKGSPIDGASTVAALKDAKLGAMNGTTSLGALNEVIEPTNRPSIFKDNSLAAQALQNGQINGLVADLPTALYMVGAQLDDGVMVGQLPGTASEAEQFGLLLAKDSPITECATEAVDALRADGTLQRLTDKWLGGESVAPVLK